VSITVGWIFYGQRFRKRRLWRIWVLIPLIFVLVTNKINLYVSMSFWFHSPYVGTTFVPIDETLYTFFHVSPFKIQSVAKFYQIFVVNTIFFSISSNVCISNTNKKHLLHTLSNRHETIRNRERYNVTDTNNRGPMNSWSPQTGPT
jgi:hypothetical protein